MTSDSQQPKGFLSFVLHAHLPYVVNHGTWPHGMEWLHEAAAETYLPLLRVLRNLERDAVPFRCNLDFSPVLLEQLAHPVFQAEFPKYLSRKIVATNEDEAFFLQSGEAHYADLARLWHNFFQTALDDFNHLDGDIISGFRHFNDIGMISLMTCCATHGYLPLLGTDESVRAQVRLAVVTHTNHFGVRPRGIWSPECGYRPAGEWSCPVADADGTPAPQPFVRAGLEEIFSDSGIEFFFVDTHLIQGSARNPGVYERRGVSGSGIAARPVALPAEPKTNSLYTPHQVEDDYGSRFPVSVFPRDPQTGLQVWSGDSGYPGDSAYLDFHKKRWPGGHRYWRVTDAGADMSAKEPYSPAPAAERVREHAVHFVNLVVETLTSSSASSGSAPPILCAPFDAELFGHWWFEGPQWLEAVARTLHEQSRSLELISAAEYLDRYPSGAPVSMPEGSWGSGGNNQVWLNAETGWTWTHIYPAERYLREVVNEGQWRSSALGRRIVQQLCRELLLLESSDWQFLITTGAARDYAEARFITHVDQFNELRYLWSDFVSRGSLSADEQRRLGELELRDGIFPDLDPQLWNTDAPADPQTSRQLSAAAVAVSPPSGHTGNAAAAE